MRRAVPIGLAVIVLLLALGAPFLGVRWGFPDDRVLPTSASSHQVGDQLRNDFADDSSTAVTVVVPDADGLAPAEIERYAAELSRVPDVSAVSAPTGTFVGGRQVGPPTRARRCGRRQRVPDGRQHRAAVLRPLRGAARPAAPGAGTRRPGGARWPAIAQVNRDSVEAITDRLPWVLGLIAVITFGLLFLLTGSVVLPLKAVVLNVLSLTAAFGALVWIFQDGHLNALGTTATGTLGGQHASVVVLHRLRPLDGLRGVPRRAHPRVLAEAAGRRRCHAVRTAGDDDSPVPTTTRRWRSDWPAPAG